MPIEVIGGDQQNEDKKPTHRLKGKSASMVVIRDASRSPPYQDPLIFSHQRMVMTSPVSGRHADSTKFYGSQQDQARLTTATTILVGEGLMSSPSNAISLAIHEDAACESPASMLEQSSSQIGSLARHSSPGDLRSPLRKIDYYFPVKQVSREKQVGYCKSKKSMMMNIFLGGYRFSFLLHLSIYIYIYI
jgi:hypothetical protein